MDNHPGVARALRLHIDQANALNCANKSISHDSDLADRRRAQGDGTADFTVPTSAAAAAAGFVALSPEHWTTAELRSTLAVLTSACSRHIAAIPFVAAVYVNYLLSLTMIKSFPTKSQQMAAVVDQLIGLLSLVPVISDSMLFAYIDDEFDVFLNGYELQMVGPRDLVECSRLLKLTGSLPEAAPKAIAGSCVSVVDDVNKPSASTAKFKDKGKTSIKTKRMSSTAEYATHAMILHLLYVFVVVRPSGRPPSVLSSYFQRLLFAVIRICPLGAVNSSSSSSYHIVVNQSDVLSMFHRDSENTAFCTSRTSSSTFTTATATATATNTATATIMMDHIAARIQTLFDIDSRAHSSVHFGNRASQRLDVVDDLMNREDEGSLFSGTIDNSDSDLRASFAGSGLTGRGDKYDGVASENSAASESSLSASIIEQNRRLEEGRAGAIVPSDDIFLQLIIFLSRCSSYQRQLNSYAVGARSIYAKSMADTRLFEAIVSTCFDWIVGYADFVTAERGHHKFNLSAVASPWLAIPTETESEKDVSSGLQAMKTVLGGQKWIALRCLLLIGSGLQTDRARSIVVRAMDQLATLLSQLKLASSPNTGDATDDKPVHATIDPVFEAIAGTSSTADYQRLRTRTLPSKSTLTARQESSWVVQVILLTEIVTSYISHSKVIDRAVVIETVHHISDMVITILDVVAEDDASDYDDEAHYRAFLCNTKEVLRVLVNALAYMIVHQPSYILEPLCQSLDLCHRLAIIFNNGSSDDDDDEDDNTEQDTFSSTSSSSLSLVQYLHPIIASYFTTISLPKFGVFVDILVIKCVLSELHRDEQPQQSQRWVESSVSHLPDESSHHQSSNVHGTASRQGLEARQRLAHGKTANSFLAVDLSAIGAAVSPTMHAFMSIVASQWLPTLVVSNSDSPDEPMPTSSLSASVGVLSSSILPNIHSLSSSHVIMFLASFIKRHYKQIEQQRQIQQLMQLSLDNISFPLMLLPPDLITNTLLSFLSAKRLCRLASTSKHFYRLISTHPDVWRHLFRHKFRDCAGYCQASFSAIPSSHWMRIYKERHVASRKLRGLRELEENYVPRVCPVIGCVVILRRQSVEQKHMQKHKAVTKSNSTNSNSIKTRA